MTTNLCNWLFSWRKEFIVRGWLTLGAGTIAIDEWERWASIGSLASSSSFSSFCLAMVAITTGYIYWLGCVAFCDLKWNRNAWTNRLS